jgi:riboflavin kinase
VSPASGSDVALLRALASRGAMLRRAKVTTSSLAFELGLSQQAVSAALIRLQDRGLVERSMAPRGQSIKLTKAGTAILKAEYAAYRRLFEGGARLTLSGKVASGLGEGAYYLSRKGYEDGLERILGKRPYRGTLNVKVDPADLGALEALQQAPGSEIPGFDEGGRTFGPIKCFEAEIGGQKAVVVMPARTHHVGALELVAAVRLRDALGLKDGSSVSISVSTE